MFTGIITAVGEIAWVARAPGGARVRVEAGALPLDDVMLGDSIAVSGVCLTVVALHQNAFEVDVSPETLACTAGFVPGSAANLEKALRLADRLGGHLVSGHVDGQGVVERWEASGDNRVVEISVPSHLERYIARKGSVAVNGVSLTVNDAVGTRFTVNLIPHTLTHTNLGRLERGVLVNIEIDLVARYIERMMRTE